MAGFKGTCLKQHLKYLPNGIYQLNYTFAARNVGKIIPLLK